MATTAVLIDFNLLKSNGTGDPTQSVDIGSTAYNEHPAELLQHMPTLVDYSAIAGSNFTEEEVKLMNVSLSPNNWEVKLNSSADTVDNAKYSKCIEWHTKFVRQLKSAVVDASGDAGGADPEGYTILGARIHFPESRFNSWATVKPPFEIPAYEDIVNDDKGNTLADEQLLAERGEGNRFLNGKGVVRNVGVIKSLTLTIYGTQFRNSISILLKDENDVVTEYSMPQYLDFDGWKKITWINPNYVTNVANRDLYVVPLYPSTMPYVKLYGFRVYRQGDQQGGDFVTYIKDVSVTFDDAVIVREEPIEHEKAWGILKDRTEDAKKREYTKLGNNQILRYLEKVKMDKTN
jgi:hypothetical protein